MTRVLRLLTYAALVLELHTWLVQWTDKRIDRELDRMLYLAERP